MGSVSRQSRKALLGKKLGMTQVFSEDGKWIPVTVLQAGPCAVLQIKTEEQDGYSSYQIGFDDRRKNAKRPQQVCFDNLGVNTKRFVREIPFIDPADILTGGVPVAPEPEEEPAEAEEAAVEEAEVEEAAPEAGGGEEASAEEEGDSGEDDAGEDDAGEDDAESAEEEAVEEEAADEPEPATEVNPGDIIGARVFEGVAMVDVRGVSKGRGFAGNVKRHGHSTGDKSHGGKSVRLVGSTGMHTDPGRVPPGKHGPGHYGNTNCKVLNLEVVEIDEVKNILLVKGAIPGPRGGYLYIEQSLSS
ncbi:MAG: 50S ribosomal protein L3 [Planctomycetota bacterium]|nr:50S ribosomal protein L3 [Planctomycetota bacterium]